MREITKRVVKLLAVALLVYGMIGYAPFLGRASAASLTSRSIKLSSSKQADTNVIYQVNFTIATTGNVGGAVIDFCTEDPIPGDTCTAPTSMNTNKATTGIYNQSGITNFAVDTTNSTTKTMILTRTAASVSSGVAVSFELGNGSNGFTNPNTTNTTFYARIFTYAASATAQAYTSASPGSYVDNGGVALSTTNQITVTAKVQEQITLCVYTGANCAAGGNAITLGDSNGILSASTAYSNASAKFDAATNATSGMIVRAKANATLTSGANTIAAIGASAASSSAGTEQFGFCVSPSGGSLTATSPYNNASCGTTNTGTYSGSAQFAFDTTNLTGTYGQSIASSSGPSTTTTGTLGFIGNISNTTKPGVYTSTLTFIGTGTY